MTPNALMAVILRYAGCLFLLDSVALMVNPILD